MPWTDDGGFTSGAPWKVNRKADPTNNVARQQADPGSLWHHYRKLIELRHRHPALGRGDYRPLPVGGKGDAIAWERHYGDERLLVVANFEPSPVEGLEVAVADIEDGTLPALFGGSDSAGTARGTVSLPVIGPRSMVIYQLAPR